MEKFIKAFEKVATFSAPAEEGGNDVAHFLRDIWDVLVSLGGIAGGIASLLGKVKA